MRGNLRVEFVCGLRALRQARQDYRLLSEIGRALSASFERAPEWIASAAARLKALEKSNQRLASELALREGRELHASTAPDADGLRRLVQRGPIDDAMRARAQAFTAAAKPSFWPICDDPPALLLAASADAGLHAGDISNASSLPPEAAAAVTRRLPRAAFPPPIAPPALQLVSHAPFCYAEGMPDNFRRFQAGPDPFGRVWEVEFRWLQTGISIRHADTVDVKFTYGPKANPGRKR